MIKIVQIVTSPDIETWGETAGFIQTRTPDIYGLSLDGKLYKWGYKQVSLDKPRQEKNEETGQMVEVTSESRKGWILLEDEINK